jgi:Protein of unknown function (DUF1203)
MDTFRLIAIDSNTANRLRQAGRPTYVADEKPGYPCRQCLCDAEVGEELVLVSHDPFDQDSPYRSASPIFLHLHPCEPATPSAVLPSQLSGRRLSVRAFDHHAMMIDAAIIDGADLATNLNRLFGNENTDRIHIHNASRGCWAVTAGRA